MYGELLLNYAEDNVRPWQDMVRDRLLILLQQRV